MYDLVTGSRIGNEPLYWTAYDASGTVQDSHKVGKDFLYNAYIDYAKRLGTQYPISRKCSRRNYRPPLLRRECAR